MFPYDRCCSWEGVNTLRPLGENKSLVLDHILLLMRCVPTSQLNNSPVKLFLNTKEVLQQALFLGQSFSSRETF
jgi:hypothetical protein